MAIVCDPVASVYAVLVEQLVGQIGYCMRPCSISVCCVGGATGRTDWLYPVASVYAVLAEQLVGQIGYCMRPCSISVCCVGVRRL